MRGRCRRWSGCSTSWTQPGRTPTSRPLENWPAATLALYLTLPNYVNNLRKIGWTEDVSGGGSDRLVDIFVPWGSAEAVARRLHEYRAAGADYVCVQVVGGDLGLS